MGLGGRDRGRWEGRGCRPQRRPGPCALRARSPAVRPALPGSRSRPAGGIEPAGVGRPASAAAAEGAVRAARLARGGCAKLTGFALSGPRFALLLQSACGSSRDSPALLQTRPLADPPRFLGLRSLLRRSQLHVTWSQRFFFLQNSSTEVQSLHATIHPLEAHSPATFGVFTDVCDLCHSQR